MIAKLGSIRSGSGPFVILMLAAFLVVGLTCVAAVVEYSRPPITNIIANFRNNRFIDTPETELLVATKKGSMEAWRPPCFSVSFSLILAIRHHGIGLVGRGCTPQT